MHILANNINIESCFLVHPTELNLGRVSVPTQSRKPGHFKREKKNTPKVMAWKKRACGDQAIQILVLLLLWKKGKRGLL